ncbi:MAG TPA: ABC transporter permease [Chthonomonadales bacterium]|nr:ABC transporter permease [Chthonomonadales bacterium]
MSWLSLIYRSAWRRRLRTCVTMAGVAAAVAALFSLLAFQRGYQTGMQGELDRLGAQVLVVPKGCPYDAASIALHGASWPCYLKESYLEFVRRTNGVAEAAPLLMNAVYDDRTGAQSVYVGALPGLLALKRSWRISGRFPVTGSDCLIGQQIAQSRRLELGQTFELKGLHGETGRVCGILAATNGADDTFVYMPLSTAQRVFKRPHQLTHILVRLKDPDSLDQVVGSLRACEAGMDMNIVPLAHLFTTIQRIVDTTRVLLACLALLALVVACAGVSNTVLLAISERTREIGVMRAMGASAQDIFVLIWLETVQICAAGGIAGLALAVLGARSVEQWLRERLPFSPSGTLVHADPAIMIGCLTGAILLGCAAGMAPAYRAARLSPVEAMRASAAF